MSYAALPTTSVTIRIDWHALALVDLWPCRRSAHKRNSDLYDVTQGQTKKKKLSEMYTNPEGLTFGTETLSYVGMGTETRYLIGLGAKL